MTHASISSVIFLCLKGGLGDDEMDVAVFRFTLGIPGFEDRFIPGVVAGLGAALLGINHLFSIGAQAAPTVALGSAELICGALVLTLALVPEIEERLREALPGRKKRQVMIGCSWIVASMHPMLKLSATSAIPHSNHFIGRGRLSTAANIAGATNAFLLDKKLSDKAKQVPKKNLDFLRN